MAKIPDVLVLGGGIIGLTSAYLLAKAGLRVEVIDRQEMGREASWAGAGILPPFGDVGGARSPIDALRANSVAGFSAFTDELESSSGRSSGYRITGGIEVLHPETAYCLPLWDAEKIAYERLDRRTLGRIEPGARTVAEAIYYVPGFAQVRNPRHLRALIAACEYEGVALTTGCPFAAWDLGEGRVRGFTDATGRLREAGAYLIASGAWADTALIPLGCRLGIHPVRGQIVVYAGAEGLLSRVILDGKRYLVPRGDGRILVGSTEEPEVGFAKANTPEGVADLVGFANGWLPGLAESGVIETTWSGLRPTSRDGLPSIGRVPGHDRVYAAVGHGRAGIQLSLGTGRMVVDLIAGRRPPDYADALRLDRPPTSNVRPAFRS